MLFPLRSAVTALLLALLIGCQQSNAPAEKIVGDIVELKSVEIPMRDGVVLRADVFLPAGDGPFPVLVYRTPYGKHLAVTEYRTHIHAAERGYAVVLQDVRGRYASDGDFDAYFNEGRDGYDTIEWAAKQAWSNGKVGSYGLSYPGAVQWLAAMEAPPHLVAMAPAMTFSSPRNFFYMNGVFDLSWLPWVYFNIAPDARTRLGLPGPVSDEEVARAWEQDGDGILSFLPQSELPVLRDEAPFYFEWLKHPPTDAWWDFAELRGRYARTDVAVLNLSGWYDEAYGPEGAATNHRGVTASRAPGDARSHLLLGPWKHGVASVSRERLGELDFGPESAIDYDSTLLRFFDHYLKGQDNGLSNELPVRYFLMGANEWREAESWPPPAASNDILCLSTNDAEGVLGDCDAAASTSRFVADPQHPVIDPYGNFEASDFQGLASRDDVLVFDSAPLATDTAIAGNASAQLFVSCDCRDFDLWVRLLDVYPDGRAINVMSPGADVQRMSYRDMSAGQQLLTEGEVYEVVIGGLMTANRFAAGHRIRLQVSASFAPNLSRNLQTGLSEAESAESRPATISVYHGGDRASALRFPVTN